MVHLNSLPPSPNQPPTSSYPLHLRTMASHESSSNSPPQSYSPSSSHSLAAAATLNAGLQNESSRRSSNGSLRNPRAERRRSSIRMNLSLNDPAIPSPGELQRSPGALRARTPAWPDSPTHHQRAPSLGELHQELENEQEMQVNRLLGMIRQQQAQIQTLQSAQHTTAVEDSTPTSERSMSIGNAQAPLTSSVAPRPRSPFIPQNLSRHSSYRSSRNVSPTMRPSSSYNDASDLNIGAPATRDESAFYQAETQMLTRENQMLKMRIRELERQLNPSSPNTHSPAVASNLNSEAESPFRLENGSASHSSAN
ncbi:hypothetical protein EJ08DRAFT_670999 [Tothia fuscella]|uniref:Uncharacterized protein n=1 Tax=Tothia fuscella TaxID=1048955 RepID=A0A9P4NPN6_9PEZI|nr:hypothetical protein EJ08DRAFT_670999 [Tothia fuscella]